tara:strand:- start:1158 stop:1304 length:147 start_codon:yes stop_codon:yes gene_type:complete
MIIGEIFPKQMNDFIIRFCGVEDAFLIAFFLWIWKLLFIGFLIYHFFK